MSVRADTVIIDHIGAKGDGVALIDGAPVYVPCTAAGDHARIEHDGARGRLIEIVTPGPARTEPVCRHFGTCGGCALQHVDDASYLALKAGAVATALSRAGLDSVDVEIARRSPLRSRRRATLAAAPNGQAMEIGFFERRTNRVAPISECHILHKDIFAATPDLARACALLPPPKKAYAVAVLVADNGLDVAVRSKRGGLDPNLDARMALAELAGAAGWARLVVDDELIAQSRAPVVDIAGARVAPPPGAFLQATKDGEAALQARVADALDGCKAVADLFSGCGTFALALARNSSVVAADGDGALLAALEAGARRTPGLKAVTVERRDLFRRPLTAADLSAFAGAVFDPPRAGAAAQAKQLAVSGLKKIAAVSCNPATFARDAALLVGGGYVLKRLSLVDQFVFSPHIELVAAFERT